MISSGKAATFEMLTTVMYPSSMQIMSLAHSYWFVCQNGEGKTKRSYGIEIKYTKTTDKHISECSFYFFPLPQNGNPKMFCKDVLGVEKPSIPGQKLLDEGPKTPPPLRFGEPRGKNDWLEFFLLINQCKGGTFLSKGVRKGGQTYKKNTSNRSRIIVKRQGTVPRDVMVRN